MTTTLLPNWTFAACKGMNTKIFFPEFDSVVEEKALVTCAGCIIREECLQWALNRPEDFGVWGGLTETQRGIIQQARSRVRCPDCRSDRVDPGDRYETCLACGLSWPI